MRCFKLHSLLPALAIGWVAICSGGCDDKDTPPKSKPDTGEIVAKVVKHIVFKLGRKVAIPLDAIASIKELVVEIVALFDGKPEKIVTRLTQEEANQLKNGGKLVIKSEDGQEYKVDHKFE